MSNESLRRDSYERSFMIHQSRTFSMCCSFSITYTFPEFSDLTYVDGALTEIDFNECPSWTESLRENRENEMNEEEFPSQHFLQWRRKDTLQSVSGDFTTFEK